MPTRVRTVLLVLATQSASVVAHAQDVHDIAARGMLLEQASAARDAGDHARALDLAQRAGAIQMTPSLRLFIASELAHAQHYADALGSAEACTREAEHDPTLRNREAIIADCRALTTQLHLRVGSITVHVPSPAPPSLRVRVAGSDLNPAFYGVPYVVDPGRVTLDATDAAGDTFHQDVEVGARAVVDVNVSLVPTTVSTATPIESASSGPPPEAQRSSASPRSRGTAGATQSNGGGGLGTVRILGIAAAAVGLVALGFGAALWLDADGTYNRCANMTGGCNPATEPRGESLAGVGMFWAGAGVAVIGAALFLFGPRPSHERPSVTVYLDPAHGLAGIRGVF